MEGKKEELWFNLDIELILRINPKSRTEFDKMFCLGMGLKSAVQKDGSYIKGKTTRTSVMTTMAYATSHLIEQLEKEGLLEEEGEWSGMPKGYGDRSLY